MSDQLPIAEVPESTWLRALAHALDPETPPVNDDLVPEDATVTEAAEPETDSGESDDHDEADDLPVHDDPAAWEVADDWSPADAGDDGSDPLHHDDGPG